MGLIHEFEVPYWNEGHLVCGIDEAGRGPMAGPCVVCGVVFPIGFDHPDITDSKKLSPHKRQELVSLIQSEALMYCYEVVDVATIDTLNIYAATQQAMQHIADTLDAGVVLTDAMPLRTSKIHESLIKGDQRSLSIAGASILAKTYRDALMVEYDRSYPEYGFKKHKGYGTREHKQAILKYGRTPIHRSSFRFKDEKQISLDI